MKRLQIFIAGFAFLFISFSNGQTSYRDLDYWTAYGIYKAFDFKGGSVRKTAKKIKEVYNDSYNIDQVCSAFNYMFKNWVYRTDPNGKEYFKDADDVLKTLDGDCDDYAIGMVSLIVALGGDARVVCVTGHAYPEVYMGKDLTDDQLRNIHEKINEFYENKYGKQNSVREMNYHIDYDKTYWLNLDWQSDFPGGIFHEYGKDAEHLVIYADGSYRKAFLNKE
jgi:hypothetical protein